MVRNFVEKNLNIMNIIEGPIDSIIPIENRILVIRGLAIMLDRDLAELYSVETKRINEQVKRNRERFPKEFMFQLTEEEVRELVAKCDRFGKLKHSSSLPYAFTEQGVAMLSSVLHSKVAIEVSICIINAFVSMRRLINSQSIFSDKIEKIERRQYAMEVKIEKIFERIETAENIYPVEGVFYDGQIFDAYVFVADLIKSAQKRLVLIDNYVDESVLVMLSKREVGVSAEIRTGHLSQQLQLDVVKHNSQYETISVTQVSNIHDRFLIVDDIVYHIGASLKDLGKKLFAFSKMALQPTALL